MRATIQLYHRCRSWNCLPLPGGLGNQNEETMQEFDLIDAVIAKYKQQRQQETELDMRMNMAARENRG